MEQPEQSQPQHPEPLSQPLSTKDQFYSENAALYEKLRITYRPNRLPRKEPKVNNSNVTVGVRIRPLAKNDQEDGLPCAVYLREGYQSVVDTYDLYKHPLGRFVLKTSSYQVDETFDQTATTDEIYNSSVIGLVESAKNGGVSTVFTFGQTGSGKTFTINEIQELVAETLMGGEPPKTERAKKAQKMVFVSNIELASRNRAYDLHNSRNPVLLLQDKNGETQWVGASQKCVRSKDQMMDLIRHAASLRRTAPTYKNDASSRAHSVCQIRIVNPITKSEGVLYLADLAGSEVARDRTGHTAEQMRETIEINKTMMVLKECIRLKAEFDLVAEVKGEKVYVPFRQSTLTKILKHVFSLEECRPCQTLVLTCVDPNIADLKASQNTLKWAERLHAAVSISESVTD